MTDAELIARLRNGQDWRKTAADRIEALIEESGRRLALARSEGVARIDQFERAEAAEAKLAKAVEALRFYSPQTVGGITFVGGDDAGKRAAAVLAELEGK